MEQKIKQYMIIPTYDCVILPDVEYQLGTQRLSEEEKSRIKIDGNRTVLLPLNKQKEKGEIEETDFFGLGVVADVVEINEIPGGIRIHVKTREKVRLTGFSRVGELMEGGFITLDEVSDITAEGEKEALEGLKKTTIELSGQFEGGQVAASFIRNCESIHDYASMFCQFYDMSPEEKYALLSTDSMKERTELIQEALLRFKGTIDMRVELNRRYDESEGNQYKKAAIRKQIGMLQQELDDMDPETASEEDQYRMKIEQAGMPAEAKKEIERVLRRYLEAQPNDPERSMLETYLEFVTQLAWTAEDTGPIDLARAKRILDRDHYGLDKVKERILQQLAVMALRKEQTGTILLLVGAPGTGKTSLGRSVAEALNRKYVRISLGGVRDEAEIRGHRRTYIGSMPGRIMEGIKRAGAMNPVMVLDEVDKLTAGFNGDPASALLEVLDPEQNVTFTDHYMNVPYDLSRVFFICTANTLDTIPGPLLDRMEVITLNGYTPVEKFHIGREHLLRRARADAGLKAKQIRVSDGAIRRMIADYTMEAGVRGLRKQFDVMMRSAAAKIVGGECERVSVTERNLDEYLGRKKLEHDRILRSCPVGVATGLAWTQAGGEILFIETSAMPGSGHVTVTGQLGDVMKESASISASLVRSLFTGEKERIDDKDIHIHVPQGAVPKDGPSAGITLFTALTSLMTGKCVDPHLAMTGEISLRGQVLPIGGLPEKLMAAQRAGIETVLIPKDNEKDLEDVPEEVKNTLKIITVETIQDVAHHALGITLPVYHTPFQ